MLGPVSFSGNYKRLLKGFFGGCCMCGRHQVCGKVMVKIVDLTETNVHRVLDALAVAQLLMSLSHSFAVQVSDRL